VVKLIEQLKADGWLVAETSCADAFEGLVRALGHARPAREGGRAFEELSITSREDAYRDRRRVDRDHAPVGRASAPP
jgi:hypothetical protein